MTAEEALKRLNESIKNHMREMSIPRIKILGVSTSLAASCCGGRGGSRWDIKNSQWECTDCGATQSTDPNYLYAPQTKVYQPKTYTNNACYTPKKCECGADTAKTSHAHWCPKFEKY